MRHTPDRYAVACRHYEKVVALCSLVADRKAFRRVKQLAHPALRAPGHLPLIDRDAAMISLVTKAATTHRSVKLLADNRLGSDAMALARVLLENVILIEWILQDAGYRLELFVESDELHVRHLATVVQAHYRDNPEVVESATRRAKRHARAMKAIFGDTQKKWARGLAPDLLSLRRENVSVEKMFEEVARPADATNPTERTRSFMGEIVYFEGSGYVHTSALALRAIAQRIASDAFFFLAVHLDDEDICVKALRSANYFALSAVAGLNRYARLELDEAIATVAACLAGTEPDEGPEASASRTSSQS